MPNSLADLARQFRFNDQILDGTTEGFSDDDWGESPESGGNPAVWILGHCAFYRRVMVRKLSGELPEADWEPLFNAGVSVDAIDGFPPVADLRADFGAVGETLAGLMAGAPDGMADADFDGQFPDGATTNEQVMHFFFMHECMHLGNLAYIRRIRGHAGRY